MKVELTSYIFGLQASKFKSRVELDERMKSLVNYIDGFYNTLDIRVVFSHLEVWNGTDRIPLSTDAREVTAFIIPSVG